MANEPRHVGRRDPAVGDLVQVDDEHFRVADRCPCGPDAQHIRWFLESDKELDTIHISQEGVLAKEWDKRGMEAWWFGRRIGASDIRTGKDRLTQRLRRNRKSAPKKLSYEGRSYRLAGTNKPPKKSKRDEGVPMAVWEYVDSEEIESLLVETSDEGDLVAYHGWYSNPEDIRLA